MVKLLESILDKGNEQFKDIGQKAKDLKDSAKDTAQGWRDRADTYLQTEMYPSSFFQNMKETFVEGLYDPRIWYAAGLDFVGVLSYLGLAIGEATDALYGPLQAKAQRELYKREIKGAARFGLTMLSLAEEMLPGTDFIPSSLVWHFAAAYARVNQRYNRNGMPEGGA